MGLGGSLEWVSAYNKKRCRSLFKLYIFIRTNRAEKENQKNKGKNVILSIDMCFSKKNGQIYHAVQCNRTVQYNLNRVIKQPLKL
jgi:hypothetical protein